MPLTVEGGQLNAIMKLRLRTTAPFHVVMRRPIIAMVLFGASLFSRSLGESQEMRNSFYSIHRKRLKALIHDITLARDHDRDDRLNPIRFCWLIKLNQ